MVTSLYTPEAKQFFEANKNMFLPEHVDEIRILEPISLPEHVQHNTTATTYRNNKYRLVLSAPAFNQLVQFLESKDKEGGSVMNAILSSYCSVKTIDRAADDRFSFASLLSQLGAGDSFPLEDEGIPGHHPGSAYTGDNPAMAGTLPRLKLGKLPMEELLEGDVRAELAEEDEKEPPAPSRNTLIQEFDQMIKKEEGEEAPSRNDIPYPPSLARDVAIEVMKVKENRDRYRLDGRTGGVLPGVSVCMFTFHNTSDSITCLDFSDDNTLVAAGFETSYIRIWTIDGSNIPETHPDIEPLHDYPPANSRRLIGHAGPVYAVAFAPSARRTKASLMKIGCRRTLGGCSLHLPIRPFDFGLWICGSVWSSTRVTIARFAICAGDPSVTTSSRAARTARRAFGSPKKSVSSVSSLAMIKMWTAFASTLIRRTSSPPVVTTRSACGLSPLETPSVCLPDTLATSPLWSAAVMASFWRLPTMPGTSCCGTSLPVVC